MGSEAQSHEMVIARKPSFGIAQSTGTQWRQLVTNLVSVSGCLINRKFTGGKISQLKSFVLAVSVQSGSALLSCYRHRKTHPLT
jgi:hypothetical protein